MTASSIVFLALAACTTEEAVEPAPAGDTVYPAGTVIFGDEGLTSYVELLPTVGAQTIDPAASFEFPGWADFWVHGDKLFVADGEAPMITRYSVDADGLLVEEGQLSFQNYGATQAAFWTQVFVDADTAWFVNTAEREVVVWDPAAMEITGSFALPELADRGELQLAGPSADRASVVRGDRVYLVFYWADWVNFDLSDDSVVLVLDASTNEVVSETSVACPELNFATVDDNGTSYFSNWGYSVVPTLMAGAPEACAVRILDGESAVDPDWSLRFSDLTDGRQASALRWLGDGKAVITVFHDERVDLGAETDWYALTDSANWRLWSLDLGSETAAELDTLDWHAPGLYGARVDDTTLLFVPSADYASTTTYGLSTAGVATPLWDAAGWQTRLFEMNR